MTELRRISKGGVEYVDPRNTRAWRKLRDQVVSEEPTCRLRLPGVCTLTSTTADHILPVESHPEFGLERSNLRGVCEPCNRARGHAPDAALRIGEPASGALSIFAR